MVTGGTHLWQLGAEPLFVAQYGLARSDVPAVQVSTHAFAVCGAAHSVVACNAAGGASQRLICHAPQTRKQAERW